MPCPKCGLKLLITDVAVESTACPRCNGIAVVERDLALRISEDRLSYLHGLFLGYMKRFKKMRLVAHIVWEREKYSRSYFGDYQGFDLSKFLSYSYLTKILMAERFDGEWDANQLNTASLIGQFSNYLHLRTEGIYLKEGFAELVAKASFQEESLTVQDKLSNFKVYFNEDYIPLLRTFANNEIYADQEAELKEAEYREQWERIKGNSNQQATKVNYSPQEMIKNSYTLLHSLQCGLQKNEIYATTFDFSNYEGLIIEPFKIVELANSHPLIDNIITCTPLYNFKEDLKRVFGDKASQVESILLFSESNTETFPLFVLFGDKVFISHRTAYLVSLLLHPILLKDYYHEETVRRSKELETTRAKEAFEKAGYNWTPNVMDRKKATLQIDGLAGRNETLFVVEVKGWGLTRFYDHRNKHEYLLRDLKGIVDGKKYRMKDDRLLEEDIPSLLEKIDYAKNNMDKHGFDPNVFKVVNGLIVIEDFPPINEYKGVRIIGLQDVTKL